MRLNTKPKVLVVPALNTCFKYGFCLDGMEESTFPDDAPVKSSLPLSFMSMRLVPPILVARMRAKTVLKCGDLIK